MLWLILTLILIITKTWTYYTYKNLWQEVDIAPEDGTTVPRHVVSMNK